MRCPRCQTESASQAASCANCGAPLLLREDPTPIPLAWDLDELGVPPHGAGLDRELDPPGLAPGHLGFDAAEDPPVLVLGDEHVVRAGARARVGVLRRGVPRPLAPALPATPQSEAAPLPIPRSAVVLAPGQPGPPAVPRRLGACAVDLGVVALFAAPPLAIAAALGPGFARAATLLPQALLFTALVGFVYATSCLALAGATAGQRLFSLRVVARGGERPGAGRAAMRAGLALLGGAAAGLGFAAALFTHGRTLHDVLAGTEVVLAR